MYTIAILKLKQGLSSLELKLYALIPVLWIWHKGIMREAVRGRNTPKISGAIWAPGIKKLRALQFFQSGPYLFFSDIFYTQVLK